MELQQLFDRSDVVVVVVRRRRRRNKKACLPNSQATLSVRLEQCPQTHRVAAYLVVTPEGKCVEST